MSQARRYETESSVGYEPPRVTTYPQEVQTLARILSYLSSSSLKRLNNKVIAQPAPMLRLVFAFVVCMQQKQVF